MANIYNDAPDYTTSPGHTPNEYAEILDRLDHLEEKIDKGKKKRKRLERKLETAKRKLKKAKRKNKKLKKGKKSKEKQPFVEYNYLGAALESLPAALNLSDTILKRNRH